MSHQDYYSNVGRTKNLIKLRSGGGEPYENQGLALWDKQYLSKTGWATNILKFQNWGRHTGKGKGKKGSIKERKKKRL